jgi:hypothetical protein
MNTISTGTHSAFGDDHHPHRYHFHLIDTLHAWIKERESYWEYYRFGIGATGIFLQVSVAALMIVTLGVAGASPWVYGIGVFLAFVANSLVFAQLPMPQLLGSVVISMVVNIALVLIYGIPLLIN